MQASKQYVCVCVCVGGGGGGGLILNFEAM